MGWNEYSFRMETDVILHKARKKKCLHFLLKVAAGWHLGKGFHEGKVQLSLFLRVKQEGKKYSSNLAE